MVERGRDGIRFRLTTPDRELMLELLDAERERLVASGAKIPRIYDFIGRKANENAASFSRSIEQQRLDKVLALIKRLEQL